MMFRSKAAAALFVVSVSASTAVAQTACPVGVNPGSPQCGPSPVAEPSLPPRINYVPAGEWIYTWGAIAIDGPTGAVGTSVNAASSNGANSTALRKCASLGGEHCELSISYVNQCAAIAWPKNLGHRIGVSSGPDLPEASKRALNFCTSNGGGDCDVVYTHCELPYFRSFQR
ncbi:DUF4189 domain-containing protein [Lysobacter sp. UKS-15]|uniref:DUF4189 domain-containing protein n=1 Tax=Cognatilysobacter lacus TaxID=1643323 RepID=A0A5D8ZBI9_9GAMM|nr:DUF4189 domain-containing protein [Lysobacter lacus]